MTAPRTVLVPLDGSYGATAAIPVAQHLAGLLHATVVLLHVGDDMLAQGTLVERMSLSAGDVQGFVIEQRPGTAADVIVREAAGWHAAMIVMCPQVRTDIRSRTFGHVADAVLRAALCPVVLVPPARGRRPWSLRQVLVPHDGTPTSAATIAPAADLAVTAAAELVVLHVATPVRAQRVEPGTFGVPRYVDEPQHEWGAWTQEFVDRLRAIGRARSDIRIRLVLAEGEAGAAIVRLARESDLVVLGWRGMLEPGRALTMQRVIHDAACPVIIFRLRPGAAVS
jgi:nucleotide-binding universal stress UspA family protein